MKKLLRSALVAGCILLTTGLAKAQTKIGYISFNDLIVNTAQYKSVQTQINDYQKSFTDILQGMQNEGQTKAAAYQAKAATMTDAERAKAEGELQDIQNRAQSYQNDASQKVQAKYAEISKPLIDRLKAVISQVAKEKGYTYVIDSSTADLLLVAPPGDDLLAAVRTALGPDTAAPAPAAAAPKAAAPKAAAPKK